MATPGSIQYVQGGNQVAAPGQPFDHPVVMRAYDTLGNPMPNEPMVWSLPVAEPSGTFVTNGLRVFTFNTDANGYAWSGGVNDGSSNIRAGTQEGTWLGAIQFVNALGINNAYYLINQNSVSTPTSITITAGQSAKATLNGAYPALSAQVRDQSNNPVAGVTVQASVPTGHGTFTGGLLVVTAATNATGDVTFPVFTANATAGAFTVSLSVPSVPAVPVTTTTWTNVDPAVATTLQVFSGSNQAAPVSAPFAQALRARATNGLGNVVANVTVTFTSPAAGASCTFPTLFAATSVNTDSNGIATSPLPLANATAGSYYVVATASGATAAQFYLTNGQAYLPEVCTTLTFPNTAANQGANPLPWANTTNAVEPTGSTNGAFVSVTNDYADLSQILLCAPIPPALLAAIDNAAKITRFEVAYEVYSSRTASYFPTVNIGIYNGTTIVSGTPQPGGPTAQDVWQARTFSFGAPFIGTAITGAQVKTGNFGLGCTVGGGGGVGGTVNVRVAKVSVCYQNPDVSRDTGNGALGICEA